MLERLKVDKLGKKYLHSLGTTHVVLVAGTLDVEGVIDLCQHLVTVLGKLSYRDRYRIQIRSSE